MAFGGTMLTASAHLKEDYCIIPEVSNHFEELEESRTRIPTKRKCVALKKKR